MRVASYTCSWEYVVGIESPGVKHSKQGTCPDEECNYFTHEEFFIATQTIDKNKKNCKSQVVEVYHSIFQLPLTFTVIDASMPLSRQSLASPVTNLQVEM